MQCLLILCLPRSYNWPQKCVQISYKTWSSHLSQLNILESSTIDTCLHSLQVIESGTSACFFVNRLLSASAFSLSFHLFFSHCLMIHFAQPYFLFCHSIIFSLFSELLFNKLNGLLIHQYVLLWVSLLFFSVFIFFHLRNVSFCLVP